MQQNGHHLPEMSYARYTSSKRRKLSAQDRFDDLREVVNAIHAAGYDGEKLLSIQEACDEFEAAYRDGMFQTLSIHVRYARAAIHAKEFEERVAARQKLEKSRYVLGKLGVNL